MKEYVVTYEKSGVMRCTKFIRHNHAIKCAMNRLSRGTYPAVKITTCEGMKIINIETYCK